MTGRNHTTARKPDPEAAPILPAAAAGNAQDGEAQHRKLAPRQPSRPFDASPPEGEQQRSDQHPAVVHTSGQPTTHTEQYTIDDDGEVILVRCDCEIGADHTYREWVAIGVNSQLTAFGRRLRHDRIKRAGASGMHT